MHPDNAVEMLRHYRTLAGLDLGEYKIEISPSLSDFGAKGREIHFAAGDFAENRATLFNRKGNHINPRLAIIPPWQADAGSQMTIFIAAVNHEDYYSIKRWNRRNRRYRRTECAWRNPVHLA